MLNGILGGLSIGMLLGAISVAGDPAPDSAKKQAITPASMPATMPAAPHATTKAATAPATGPTTKGDRRAEKEVPPTGPEEEFYKIVNIPIPPEFVVEVSALEVMPDGKVAVGTRRGDIFMLDNAYADPADKVVFTRWATGLHEIMGLAQRDGWVYASQRGEITRLKDSTKSGKADTYETFYDGWGIRGDYHEYPLMSRFDKEGNLYVALCLTGSGSSHSPFRGWVFKITPEGKGIPIACGVRSPGGVGFNHLGEIFYTDNQGFWNGADNFKQVIPGAFTGCPIGNNWYEDALKLNPDFGPKPPEPKSPSRWHIEAAKFPTLIPPPVMLPYKKMGQSASGILCDMSDGKFGPFNHQLFVADQSHSNVARLGLEKVKGKNQGFAVPFRNGFASGIVPMVQAKDGSWFVGGTNRGWGSTGSRPYALERLVWTGKTPFELLDMQVKADGFELAFTQPLDAKSAADPASYDLSAFTYIYQASYGSPESDKTEPKIKSITPSGDGLKVKLAIDGLVIGSIHELHMDGLRRAGDAKKPLLHTVAYYTLWNLPDADAAADGPK
jgi:glucose/arabinose dehydrogenase